ncbi:MAG: hypothetical protein M3Y08_11815 [Fibrobacterota bacterium]|nr:hypothetical protein [Fibrobacterota bacterium]
MDTTPPMAALDVVGRDTTMVMTVGGEPEALMLARGDSLILIAVGVDLDGGIKDLSLSGNAVVTCKDRKTGQVISRSGRFLRQSVSGSSPMKKVPKRKTSRFVLRAGDFAALCPGRTVETAVGQAAVRTVNYRGGNSDSPRLEFRLVRDSASLAPAVTSGAAVTSKIPPLASSAQASAALICPPADLSSAALSRDGAGAASSAFGLPKAGPDPICSDGTGPVPFKAPGRAGSDPDDAVSDPAAPDKAPVPPQMTPKTQGFLRLLWGGLYSGLSLRSL